MSAHEPDTLYAVRYGRTWVRIVRMPLDAIGNATRERAAIRTAAGARTRTTRGLSWERLADAHTANHLRAGITAAETHRMLTDLNGRESRTVAPIEPVSAADAADAPAQLAGYVAAECHDHTVSEAEAVAVVEWCREWASDCAWQDADATDIERMSSMGVLVGAARALDGGLAVALADVRHLAASGAVMTREGIDVIDPRDMIEPADASAQRSCAGCAADGGCAGDCGESCEDIEHEPAMVPTMLHDRQCDSQNGAPCDCGADAGASAAVAALDRIEPGTAPRARGERWRIVEAGAGGERIVRYVHAPDMPTAAQLAQATRASFDCSIESIERAAVPAPIAALYAGADPTDAAARDIEPAQPCHPECLDAEACSCNPRDID